MSNLLTITLQQLEQNQEKAFVPYIMAGDGGLETLNEKLLFLQKSGATVIEVGIPFSDPVADGPTIQGAGIRALKNGTTLKKVLRTISEVKEELTVPLVIMTYLNPVFSYGLEAFFKEAKAVGVAGLIVPDLPFEEESLLDRYLEENEIELIRLVTLTSPDDRIKAITSKGKGFVYAVTVTGITGSRTVFRDDLGPYLEKVKKLSPLPVFAGFGISQPEQVHEVLKFSDGVIVGSRIVDLFHQGDRDGIVELIQASKKINVEIQK